MIYNPFQKPITIDQACIMAFKMHDRKDCGLLRAFFTAFELRYQINFLSELGISEKDLKEILDEPLKREIIPTY